MSKKKYTVSIFGTGETVEGLIVSFANHPSFDLKHIVPDPSVDKKMFDINFKKFCIDEPVDLCLVSDYRSRIDYFNEDSLWLNIHAGLLPDYRGFSSNSWAILNGETEIGYTLHKLIYDLDAGPIFIKREYSINKNEQYQDIRPEIIQNIISKTPNDCLQILEKSIVSYNQDEKSAKYCGKLNTSDGMIDNFSVPSLYIYNLFRIFAKPLGSGLFYANDNKTYEIDEVILPINETRYIGINGLVVNKTEDFHWIKTLDSTIGVKFRNYEKKIGSRL
jgi:methionyl-tRNA formyltransferase